MREQCVPGSLLSFVGPGNEAKFNEPLIMIMKFNPDPSSCKEKWFVFFLVAYGVAESLD